MDLESAKDSIQDTLEEALRDEINELIETRSLTGEVNLCIKYYVNLDYSIEIK